MELTHNCPTCKSINFIPSIVNPNMCEFCDGTCNGEGPDDLIVEATIENISYDRKEKI